MKKITKNWGKLISYTPLTTQILKGGSFINPSILIETKIPNKITEVIHIQFEGELLEIALAEQYYEVSPSFIDHNTQKHQHFPLDDCITDFTEENHAEIVEPDADNSRGNMTTQEDNNVTISPGGQPEVECNNTYTQDKPTYEADHHIGTNPQQWANTNTDHVLDIVEFQVEESILNTNPDTHDRIWEFRKQDNSSTSSISTTSDYQAEAIHIADANQPIHKTAQLSLCKGLFGLHIRRGRGRPKKFFMDNNTTKTKRGRAKSNKKNRRTNLLSLTILGI